MGCEHSCGHIDRGVDTTCGKRHTGVWTVLGDSDGALGIPEVTHTGEWTLLEPHTPETVHCWGPPEWGVDTSGVRLTSVPKKLGCGQLWGQTDLYVDTSGVTRTKKWTILSHPDWSVAIHRVTHTGVWTSQGSDSLSCGCPWAADAPEVTQIRVWSLLESFGLGCGPSWAQTT